MRRRDIILLLAALALVVLPLVIVRVPSGTQAFLGADGQAQELVGRIAPGYRPWAAPIWTPPSGEVASLLFAVQAGLGCGFIGYYVGLSVGRRRRAREKPDVAAEPSAATGGSSTHA